MRATVRRGVLAGALEARRNRNETRARARDLRRARRGGTRGGSAQRARLADDARRRDEDERPRQRRLPPRRLRRAHDQRRPEPPLPDDGGLRRLDHRLLGARARAPGQAHARRDDAEPVQPRGRRRPVVPAPADGGVGLRRRRSLHLRRPAGGPDRLRDAALLDRARPRGDPAAAAPGARAQPADQGDRVAVEPTGLDEDQRIADRRAADR